LAKTIQVIVAAMLLLATVYFFDPFNFFGVPSDTLNAIYWGLIASAVTVTLTIVMCLLVGVLLRIPCLFSRWIRANPTILVIGLIFGLILIIVSRLEMFKEIEVHKEGDFETSYERANNWLPLPGWLILAFSLLHVNLKKVTDQLSRKVLGKDDWSRPPE